MSRLVSRLPRQILELMLSDPCLRCTLHSIQCTSLSTQVGCITYLQGFLPVIKQNNFCATNLGTIFDYKSIWRIQQRHEVHSYLWSIIHHENVGVLSTGDSLSHWRCLLARAWRCREQCDSSSCRQGKSRRSSSRRERSTFFGEIKPDLDQTWKNKVSEGRIHNVQWFETAPDEEGNQRAYN